MRRMPSAASIDVEAERLGDRVAHARARAAATIELHLAAEEVLGVEPAEHADWRRSRSARVPPRP